MEYEFENTKECIRLLKSVIETIDYYQKEDTEELEFTNLPSSEKNVWVKKTDSGYNIEYLNFENAIHELVHLGDATLGMDKSKFVFTVGVLGCYRSFYNSVEEKAYGTQFAFQHASYNDYYWLSSTKDWMKKNNKLESQQE